MAITRKEALEIVDLVIREIKKRQYSYITDGKLDLSKFTLGTLSGIGGTGGYGGAIADGAIYDRHVSGIADIQGSKVLIATETTRGTVELATDVETSAGLVIQADDPRIHDTIVANSTQHDSRYYTKTEFATSGASLVGISDLEEDFSSSNVEDALHELYDRSGSTFSYSLGDHEYSGTLTSGIAGTNLVFGDLVVLTSNGKWLKADSDSEELSCGVLSIVVSGATTDSVATLLLQGYVRDDDWNWDTASGVFISSIAGEMTEEVPSADGTFSRKVADTHSSHTIYFSPDSTILEIGDVINSFLVLSDTPDSYVGKAYKVLAVKATEDGLEFVTQSGGNTLLSLTDTPDEYVGHSGHYLRVNAEENAFEYSAAAMGNFTELKDVPSGYDGQAGLVVAVTDGESGLEFIDVVKSVNSLTESIVVSGEGSISVTANGQNIVISGNDTFAGLSDVPANYNNSSNKIVMVNTLATGLVFSNVIIIPTSLEDNLSYAGLVCSGIAGETLSFGNVAHFISGSWYKSIATSVSGVKGQTGLVVVSGETSSDIMLLFDGTARNDSWNWDIGDELFLSSTSGEMVDTVYSGTGEFVRKLATSYASNMVWFKADSPWMEV